MGRFDPLCANEPKLTKLRTSIRELPHADRAEFGGQPTVDSWLGKWDEGFSARLGDAGFLGLTIPESHGSDEPHLALARQAPGGGMCSSATT